LDDRRNDTGREEYGRDLQTQEAGRLIECRSRLLRPCDTPRLSRGDRRILRA
jgi:hypothetical protein